MALTSLRRNRTPDMMCGGSRARSLIVVSNQQVNAHVQKQLASIASLHLSDSFANCLLWFALNAKFCWQHEKTAGVHELVVSCLGVDTCILDVGTLAVRASPRPRRMCFDPFGAKPVTESASYSEVQHPPIGMGPLGPALPMHPCLFCLARMTQAITSYTRTSRQ